MNVFVSQAASSPWHEKLRVVSWGGGNNEHCNKIVFIHHVLARQKVSSVIRRAHSLYKQEYIYLLSTLVIVIIILLLWVLSYIHTCVLKVCILIALGKYDLVCILAGVLVLRE